MKTFNFNSVLLGLSIIPATIFAQWDPPGANDLQNIFRGGKVGIGTYYVPDDPGAWYNSVVGNYFAAPQLEVGSENYCGINQGNAAMISSFSIRTGPSGGSPANRLRHNNYIRRKANGYNWNDIAIHDGISIDDQYLYPGVTTLTYWERDPYHDIQSWGTGQSAYMTLDAGKLLIGNWQINIAGASAHKQNSGAYTGALLQVYGTAVAQEIVVTTQNWSDFVFDKNYKLRPLQEVENFYKENHHLPEVPSAKDISEKGIDLGKTDALLLQKIEELTLYLVDLNKKVAQLQKENRRLTEKLK